MLVDDGHRNPNGSSLRLMIKQYCPRLDTNDRTLRRFFFHNHHDDEANSSSASYQP